MTEAVIGLVVLLALTIAGGVKVVVAALSAQQAALDRVTEMARDQAKMDADERHSLADRLQHPEIARPFRTAPPPPPPAPQTAGLGLAGLDVSHLTDAELQEEFGKDILDALG